MKQKKRRHNGADTVLRLIISLDVGAETLGAGDGYLYVSDGGKKKRKPETGRDNAFSLTLRNTDEGACVCEITARRETAEWERLSQNDLFRYADAVAEDLLAQVRKKPGLDLAPHIREITVETPPETALRDGAEGPLRDKAARLFPERQQMRITDLHRDAGLLLCQLKKTDGYVAAPFRAGQTVRLYLPGGTAARASLCCSPATTKEGRYTVALPADDEITASLRAGGDFEVSAPEGTFFHTALRDHRTVIGLTDEIGLPSFLSMAYALRDHLNNFKLTVLLFSCNDGDAPLSTEWEAVCAGCARVQLLRLPANESVTPETLKGRLPHEAYSVFLCGTPAFCDAAQTAVAALGLPGRNVRCERR